MPTPSIEFDTVWLTGPSGNANPDEKALELYADYWIHVRLSQGPTAEAVANITSEAFEGCTLTIPPGATTAVATVKTKRPCPDWTVVKLEPLQGCQLGKRDKVWCWVEAPIVSFAESPLLRAGTQVTDLLSLWAGKYSLSFKLSYAPHEAPAGVQPHFKLTYQGQSEFVSLPGGVVSFEHEIDLKAGHDRIALRDEVVGCATQRMQVGRLRKTRVAGFVQVAVNDPTILFLGIEEPGPWEDGQKVHLRFGLQGTAGSDGAKATFSSAALGEPAIQVQFAPYCESGTERLFDATIKPIKDLKNPKRAPTGYLHEFTMRAGQGCGNVENGSTAENGAMGPARDIKWPIEISRPRITFDPQVTHPGPFKPGDKLKVRVVLLDGPPKHADIVVKIACESIENPPTLTFRKGEEETDEIVELTVQTAAQPKYQHFDIVTLEKDRQNCVIAGSDLDHAVIGVPIHLDWMKVGFHRDHPYRPEHGVFAGEKIYFTLTHSYPAPAGAKVDLVSRGVNNREAFDAVVDKVLDSGKLMTIVEVTAKDDLKPGSKYTVEVKPKSHCIKGEKDVIKGLEVHIPATLMFGGKRKQRIAPDGPYEAGQQVTLTVHLEYHPKGLPNTVAQAPAGGCHFVILCGGFKDGQVKGTIPAGRSEGVVTAELGTTEGNYDVVLGLTDHAGNPPTTQSLTLVRTYKGCRVSSEAKHNSFKIKIAQPCLPLVSFDDGVTSLTPAPAATQTSTLTLKLSHPALKKLGKKTMARVSSKAFARPYLVEFAPGETTNNVTVTWANPSPGRQLVRVDGVQMCGTDDKTLSSRSDPGLSVTNRQHMFTVEFPQNSTTSVIALCPHVKRAIEKGGNGTTCTIPKFEIVECHGKHANLPAARGAKREGVFPVPENTLVQMIAGSRAPCDEESAKFHRTEVLFRFPGNNIIKDESRIDEIHPAIYLYRIDRMGNRTTVLPINPHSEVADATLDVVPGLWDVRFPVVAGSDIRGLQVHQATLPLLSVTSKSKVRDFFLKPVRNIPTVDFWNMLRQQKPRVARYEVEVHDCSPTPRKVRLEVYPSDEYAFTLSIKPFAPFSWGQSGSCVRFSKDVTRTVEGDGVADVTSTRREETATSSLDDLRTKSWESQYCDSDDYLSTSLKLGEFSAIGGRYTGGAAHNAADIAGNQGPGAIPRLTVESLNLLASPEGGLTARQQIVFQIAESFCTPRSKMKLTKGNVEVQPGDFVLWDKGQFVKTSSPTDIRRSIAELDALTPNDREIYEVSEEGTIKSGLVRKDGALAHRELPVTSGSKVAFDSKTRRWSVAPSTECAELEARYWVDGSIRRVTNAGKLKLGAVEVSAGDWVIWRQSRGCWEKIDVTSCEELSTPADKTLRLELSPDGTTIIGARHYETPAGWSQVPRRKVAHLKASTHQDGSVFMVIGGGKLGSITVSDGDLVKYDTTQWTKVQKPLIEWQTGWFDWVPQDGECYVLADEGPIDGVTFCRNDLAIREGGKWTKATPCGATVEVLNELLTEGDSFVLSEDGTAKPGDVPVQSKNIVVWKSVRWAKVDQPVRWTPKQFNEREELLLNTFVLTDAGTPRHGSKLNKDERVRWNAKKLEWEAVPQPTDSRRVKSLGQYDDSEWMARISGADSQLPLTSTKPFRSSYCFYPGESKGGLPESWTQAFGIENLEDYTKDMRDGASDSEVGLLVKQNENAKEFQKELNAKSLYAGFIPAIVGDRISIAMTRNDREDSLCAEMRRLAFTIAAIAQNFQLLLDSTVGAVPTMGYSVSGVINILEGDLIVRWGWKELTDNQVFYWEQIHANLMVFRVGARVDVGFRFNVMVVRFEAIVYFKVTLELKFEKAWERRGPGEALQGDSAWTSVVGKIELGASIVLLHENWLSANAAGTSGIEAKCRWVSVNAGGLEWQIYFLGVVLNAKFKLLGFKERTATKELIKGSPPGIPWKRGMVPGAANPTYFDIRATYGLRMSKIIWDKNHLSEAMETMVEVQLETLQKRKHDTCNTCNIKKKEQGWPVATTPEEPGWGEQWTDWVQSTTKEEGDVPKLMRWIAKALANWEVTAPLKRKLDQLEKERMKLWAEAKDRMSMAERKLDEIAGLERRVDDAEASGDERAETLEELKELADETELWMLEVRRDDPSKPAKERRSIGAIARDIQWWCERMKHYTSFQKHW
jgi:hypothetical protein